MARWPGGLKKDACPPQGQCCIYLLRNTVNGMKYVGVSWSLRRRIKDHSKKAGPSKSYVRNAINEYGIEAFELSILFTGERRECLEREKQLIDEHGSLAPNGYNICGGGEGSVAAMTGERNYWYGKKFTPEHRAKISAGNRGQKRDPDLGKKISALFKGRPVLPDQRVKISATLTGRKLSESHKAAMSRANIGKTLSPEHREKIRQAHLKRAAQRKAAGLTRSHVTDTYRQNLSSALKAKWQDPQFREKMIASRRKYKEAA